MRACRSTLAIGLFAVLIGSAVHAKAADVQAELVAQGQYWQARGNLQRATEVWQKVLMLSQNQVNALYGMGLVSVKQNQLQQAHAYLVRLQALSPVPWQARQLAQDIALATSEKQVLLDEARRLVDAGEREKATEVFRQMFNGLTPEGTIGREYYNNLAFNTGGWTEARKGMERLLLETPDDSILALFYGKQLARHPDSREEGARVLSRLTRHVDIAGDADESWRLALVWMGPPTAAQIPLFEEFLKVHPEDQGIREQMDKGRQKMTIGKRSQLIDSGFRALDQGDLVAAEKDFQEYLASHPDDPDALGGLGVLRQRQNRYAEAEQLLSRAISKGASQWTRALDSVRYWSLIQQGRDLQAEGKTAQAQELLAQAMRLDPKNIDGCLAIADLQVKAGEFDHAVSGYRQVLAIAPGNPSAIRGLVSVLSQTGQTDEALRLLDSLSSAEQAKFGAQGRLRSLRAIQLADMAEQRGDITGAENALQEAIKNDPDNVWTHFSLARLYVKSGEQKKADEMIDGFLKIHPDNVDALYARTLLSVEMERWSDAQATIDRIPVGRRSASMNDLEAQITLTRQIDLALTFVKSGQRQDALAVLDRLQTMASSDPDRTTMLASAYVDAGNSPRALDMMQSLLTKNSMPSSNLKLQYAAILLKTGDDEQVYPILIALQSQPLGVAARKRYDDLLYLYRIRQADRLREGGDLASAYDMLAPALAQRPGDVAVTSALARLYVTNGDSAKALELYKPLALRHPKDVTVLLNTADAAVQSRDNAFAVDMLDQLVRLQTLDPASLTEAARLYRAVGKTGEATELLRKAVAIERSEKQRVLAEQAASQNVPANPFRRQHSQLASDAASAIPAPVQTALHSGDVPVVATVAAVPADIRRSNAMLAQADAPSLTTAMASVVTVTPRGASASQPTSPVATLAVDSGSPSEHALTDILQTRSGYITQGVSTRSNDSEAGLSQLTDIEAPFELHLPIGDDHIAVRVTPVSLNAGSMNDSSASRFGGGSSSAAGVGSQRAQGVGVGVAYVLPDEGVKADIGTTPIGFKYANAVGGVSIEQALEGSSDVHYGVTLSRRAVTDSLTSFAGTTDQRDGRSWGGVTANGGRIELSYDDAEMGLYTYGALHRLLGHNVESNTRVEFGGGTYRYLQNEPNSKLTAGISATVLGYANNQDFLTYGNGGYFSPQSYVALGLPVTWAQRSERFTYQVKTTVGVQHFQQDSANYFPTDATLQAASNLVYAKQSKTGLGYSMEAAGEYRFGPKLFVGGTLRLNNSNDYKEMNVGMYLRYTFEDMRGCTMTLPVSSYQSPYSN